jgi:hypothetical protein
VHQGTTVMLGGMGFDVANGVAVDLFCACPNKKVGPFFIPGLPGSSVTANLVTFPLPAMGMTNSPNTGPGSFVVSNAGAGHTYAKKSNAVSALIGALIHVLSVSQPLPTSPITVIGSGFSKLTVINLFNKMPDGTVENLGGLKPDGSPEIPLNIISDTMFSFAKPAGGVAGPAYLQAFSPPFVPFTSSDNDPGGSFTLK